MAERLLLIDYGSGNLRSAAKALQRAADDAQLEMDILISSSAKDVQSADRIVLPGVGAFRQCAAALQALPGMLDSLNERVGHGAVPFLGICVGMQLMASRGLEYGACEGLGWIPGDVTPLAPTDPSLKIPHMGWNAVEMVQPHPVLHTLPQHAMAYFVHSFEFKADAANIYATTRYGDSVTAIVARNTMIGTQFHPEKSQSFGLALLAAFLRWRP